MREERGFALQIMEVMMAMIYMHCTPRALQYIIDIVYDDHSIA